MDSSQKSHKAKGQGSGSGSGALALNGSETLIKNVLQDPLWLLMANVDKDVMMSYQLPSRWVGRERRNRPPIPLLVMPLTNNQPPFLPFICRALVMSAVIHGLYCVWAGETNYVILIEWYSLEEEVVYLPVSLTHPRLSNCLKYWVNKFFLKMCEYFSFRVTNVHAKFQNIDVFWKGCFVMTCHENRKPLL